MDDSFDALPPYPGVSWGPPSGFAAPPPPPGFAAPPPAGIAAQRPASRRPPWLGVALGAVAVGVVAAAFLLGRSTAPRTPSELPTATALSALTSATATVDNASCAPGTAHGIAAGTLKLVSGSTLTVTTPKGTDVTVKTDGNTKVTKVVKAALGDVTVGTTVAVHGTSSAANAIAADQVALLPAAGLKPFAGGRLGPRGLAVGTVTSVSSSGFTLTVGTTTVTVTTSSSTAFSKTVTATVGDLTVGQPVAVAGTPNSDGSITATMIGQAGAGTGLGRLPGFGFGGGVGPGRFGHGPGRGPSTSGPTTTAPAGSP